MLDLPLIRALDLRRPHAAAEQIEWDWPQLPSFLKRRVVVYNIVVNPERLEQALARVQAIIRLGAPVTIYEGEMDVIRSLRPSYRRRPIRKWDWPRILVHLGSFIAIATCVGLLLEAAWH